MRPDGNSHSITHPCFSRSQHCAVHTLCHVSGTAFTGNFEPQRHYTTPKPCAMSEQNVPWVFKITLCSVPSLGFCSNLGPWSGCIIKTFCTVYSGNTWKKKMFLCLGHRQRRWENRWKIGPLPLAQSLCSVYPDTWLEISFISGLASVHVASVRVILAALDVLWASLNQITVIVPQGPISWEVSMC